MATIGYKGALGGMAKDAISGAGNALVGGLKGAVLREMPAVTAGMAFGKELSKRANAPKMKPGDTPPPVNEQTSTSPAMGGFGASVSLVAGQNKYIDDYRTFTSKNIQTMLTTITANLLLNPVQDVVKLAELNTIYFDFDKHNIRTDAALELDKIVNLMQNEYPEMVIRIESHTDSRGELSYNDKLSIDRANSTYEYLISKGISWLSNSCSNIGK